MRVMQYNRRQRINKFYKAHIEMGVVPYILFFFLIYKNNNYICLLISKSKKINWVSITRPIHG